MNVIPSFLLFCAVAFAAHRAPGASEPCIVTLRPGADAEKVAKEFKLKPKHTYRHALNGFAVALDSDKVKKLKNDKRVLAVEPDGLVELCEQTNSLGILRMGITNFPVARINGLDERIDLDVALLDTGIQTNHPDLNVVRWVGIAPGTTGDDWDDHGTKMAGIIGALDNDFGVVGIAPGVRLWSVGVFPTGSEYSSWSLVIAGIDFVAANADKISIVNASLGGPGAPPAALRQAVANLVNQGVVFVAGTGNDHEDIAGADGVFGTIDDITPAALPEVMAVSAMAPYAYYITDFSNFSSIPHARPFVFSPGGAIDVAAPGDYVLTTTIGSGYTHSGGTSAATAHASGLVALYIAANGRARSAREVYRIRQAIVDSGLPQSEWGRGCWDEFGNYHDDGSVWTGDPDNYPEPLAVASENWVPKPSIANTRMSPEGFQIGFVSVPGYTYKAQYSGSLTPPIEWADLIATNVIGMAATITVTDPAPNLSRFYRLMRQPSP